MRIFIIKNIVKHIIIAAIWIGIWQCIAMLVNDPLFVPTPCQVLLRGVSLMKEGEFWSAVLMSVTRILAGFFLGIFFGALMGFVTSIGFMDSFFSPLKLIIRATPVASFIMLAWVWIQRGAIPVVISALMIIPVVWGNVSTGIKGVTREHKELASVYRFSLAKKLKYIYIPSVVPYFAAALCTSAGLVWKAGVAAEVLCQPKNSIGAQLFYAKGMLETADIFAWTVVVVIISLLLEISIKFALKKLEIRFDFAGLT